ncbi:MAG: hypothetical protein IPH16_19695 [Haliscomenobacter sp.]|nr:hypothetical protein [Haliscomenobacter sp.]
MFAGALFYLGFLHYLFKQLNALPMDQFHQVCPKIKVTGLLKNLLIGYLAIATCNLMAQESLETQNFSLKTNLQVSKEGFNAQHSPPFQGVAAKQPLNDAARTTTDYGYALEESLSANHLPGTQLTGGLRVKGLYILPAGQVEKPRAKEAIAAILAIMQSHYLKMLGVTFEFDPEVSVCAQKIVL